MNSFAGQFEGVGILLKENGDIDFSLEKCIASPSRLDFRSNSN